MKFQALIVVMVLLAGCANVPDSDGMQTTVVTTDESDTSVPTTENRTTISTTRETQSQTPTPKGSVSAQVVSEPPANVTMVSFENETLQKQKYQIVREIVSDAVRDESGFAQQYVYGDDVENTVDVMATFPYYEGDGQAGVYIEKNDTVVEVLAYREDN